MEDMTYIVSEDSPFYAKYADVKRINILCLGLNDGLSDTIMLASYDTKQQKIDMISIPRDTYYYRSGYKDQASMKINAIYYKGGAVGTAQAVSDVLLGIPINYYAVIDYKGVGKIVDGIGGVPVHIGFHMHYEDPYDKPPLYIDFLPGDVVLTGDNAIKYLRFRKGSPGYKSYPGGGDIGRIKAHQDFIKSAFSSALDTGLVKTASLVLENVDSDLTLGAATKIATHALFMDKEGVNTYLLPGKEANFNGLSFWQADKDQISQLIDEIYGRTEAETTSQSAVE